MPYRSLCLLFPLLLAPALGQDAAPDVLFDNLLQGELSALQRLSAITALSEQGEASTRAFIDVWRGLADADSQQTAARLYLEILQGIRYRNFTNSQEGGLTVAGTVAAFELLLETDETRDAALALLFESPGLRAPELSQALADRLGRASKKQRAAYGLVLARGPLHTDAKGRRRCLRAIEQACGAAAELLQHGASKLVPWLVVGDDALAFRSQVWRLLAEESAPDSAELLGEALRLGVGGEDDVAAAVAAIQTRSWQERDEQAVLKRMLTHDSRRIVLAALAAVEISPEIEDFSRSLHELSGHYRPTVRDAANRLLSAIGEPLEEPEAPMPDALAATLARICRDAMVDPVGAERAQVSYGDRGARRGWFFSAGGKALFVADDLDAVKGDEHDFTVERLDFDAEMEGPLGGPDDPLSSGLTGAGLNLFRLAWSCRLEQAAKVRGSPRSSGFFLRLIEGYDSEAALVQAFVSEVAWFRFSACIQAFAKGQDAFALSFAGFIEGLADVTEPGWERPYGWLADCRQITAEIRARQRAVPAAQAPEDPREAAAYWVARLPELRYEQWASPGGTELTGGDDIQQAIYAHWREALGPLHDALASERLCRGYSMWRSFARDLGLIRVRDVARQLIKDIVSKRLGVEIDRALLRPGRKQAFLEWVTPRLEVRGTPAEAGFLLDEARDLVTAIKQNARDWDAREQLELRLRRLASIDPDACLDLIVEHYDAMPEDLCSKLLYRVEDLLPAVQDATREAAVAFLAAFEPGRTADAVSGLCILWDIGETEPLRRALPELIGMIQSEEIRAFDAIYPLTTRIADPELRAWIAELLEAEVSVEVLESTLERLTGEDFDPQGILPVFAGLLKDRRKGSSGSTQGPVLIADRVVWLFWTRLRLPGIMPDYSRASYDQAIRLLRLWLAEWGHTVSPGDDGWTASPEALTAWDALLAGE